MSDPDRDFVIVVGNRVTALDRESGRPAWSYDPESRAVHRFAIDGNRVFLLDYAGAVHCLDRKTGNLIGKVDLKLKQGHAILAAGENVYVVGERDVIALDSEGRVLWRETHDLGSDWGLLGLGVGKKAQQPDYSRS